LAKKNKRSKEHHLLLPQHNYLHNNAEAKSENYVFVNDHISNLEMLESVLLSANKSKRGSNEFSKNGNDHQVDDAADVDDDSSKKSVDRKVQLFNVEKMLHEDAKLKNVKLRSALGVTKNDTIISLRQLLTALFILKGDKDFVVIV
jgi:hypothetical protein